MTRAKGALVHRMFLLVLAAQTGPGMACTGVVEPAPEEDGVVDTDAAFARKFCGDLTCSPRESCSSCPQDCGGCAAPADTVAPSVAITAPAGGAVVSGSFVVSGTASDEVGVTRVDLQVDSAAWAAASGTTAWTALVDAAALTAGTHVLRARATDAAGNSRTATVAVTVPAATIPQYPGDPGPGKMYYGSTKEGGDSALPGWESTIGMKLQPYRFYESGSDSATSIVNRVKTHGAAGRLPWVSIKFAHSWTEVAAGAEDARFTAIASGLADVTFPVFLTLHHEPNGDGNGPDFVAMWVHVTDLMRSHDGGKITYVPILNGFPFEADPATARTFIPPADTYDVFGFDIYNPYSATNTRWREFSDRVRFILPYVPAGKRWAVGEYGTHADPADPERAPMWMQNMYEYAIANGAMMVSYFHSDANSPDGGWTLTDARLDRFIELSYDPRTARWP